MNLINHRARALAALLLWPFIVLGTPKAFSEQATSAAIQAAATVVYPVGIIDNSNEYSSRLLYHPVGAGIVIEAKGYSGTIVLAAAREPMSELADLTSIQPDTVTIINTEN